MNTTKKVIVYSMVDELLGTFVFADNPQKGDLVRLAEHSSYPNCWFVERRLIENWNVTIWVSEARGY